MQKKQNKRVRTTKQTEGRNKMNNYILKDYISTGTDYDSFKKEGKLIDDSTFIKKVPTDLINALFCYKQIVNGEKIASHCQVVFDGSVYPAENGGFERVENVILNCNAKPDSIERKLQMELKENLLLNFEEDFSVSTKNFFLDDAALKTLANKISVKQGLLKKDNFTKALIITSAFSDIENSTICYRSNGTYNRIIAFVGDRYQRTTFERMQELTDSALKHFEFSNWKITNKNSFVALSYKDYTIKIETSEACEFADSVNVYLNEFLEYKLLSKPIAEIEDMEEYFDKLKESIDKIDGALKIKVDENYSEMKASINSALGSKTSKEAFKIIEGNEASTLKVILQIPKLITLSQNQKKEYSNIFMNLFRKELCA